MNEGTEPSCFTNMFTILYGPPGSGKNTAIYQAENLLAQAVPEAPILPEGFTFESLKSYLAAESKEKHMAKGFIVSPELTNLIGGREYQKLTTSFLSDLWDCRPQIPYYTQANKYELIEKPYIVHLAATSPQWLQEADPKSLTGGYLRRIITVVEYVPKPHETIAIKDRVKFGAIAKVMRARLRPEAFGATNMRMEDEAIEEMEKWYRGTVLPIQARPSEVQSSFGAALQVHALKVAACLGVLEGSPPDRMGAEHFRVATRLLDLVMPQMFQAYNALVPTPYARLKATILRLIQSAGEGGCEEAELYVAAGDTMGVKDTEIAEAVVALGREKRVAKRSGRFVLGERRN